MNFEDFGKPIRLFCGPLLSLFYKQALSKNCELRGEQNQPSTATYWNIKE